MSGQTTRLTDEVSIFMFLLALVGGIFFLSELPRLKRFFHYFPPLIFCYFLPMIATTAGLIPDSSPLYSWFNRMFLPPLLLLLLLSADLRSILRLGPTALIVMLSGTAGGVIGGVVGYALFREQLDPLGWKNIGALTASWTGGSANMFAVKSALEIPDKVFSPMIVVDSVLAYSWMGMLIALAVWQSGYAKRFGADMRALDQINARIREYASQERRPASTRDLLVTFSLAMVLGHLCVHYGTWANAQLKPYFAQMKFLESFSAFTLAVIFVTVLGIGLSMTPLRKLEQTGASTLGYTMLYILLPTFGAQANLREFGMIPWYGAVGLVMLLFHGVFLYCAMRLTKAPLFLGAVGSQANVGGPASAAIVATAYQSALAPVGVLLGILGGILGTFAGLLSATLCSYMAP